MQTTLQDKLNFDDVYFRDLSKAVLGAYQDKIWWINNFSTEARVVTVPFYYSMTGDETFLLDSFVDDVPSERVELNTDIIPRGHITITSVNAEFSKIRNPHVWMRSDLEHDEEMYSIYSKVKAIPMSTTFDIEIQLDSEIDVWKCYTKILDVFALYKYMDFQHRGIYIEAVFALPEGKEITMPREQDLGTDSTITIKFPVEVKSYYPAINLGYNGSLKEFQKIVGVDENGESVNGGGASGTGEFIVTPGVFGNHFFMANKRAIWNFKFHQLDQDDIDANDAAGGEANLDP